MKRIIPTVSAVCGSALLLLLVSAPDSLAHANNSIAVKGSGFGTFVTASFSYDGIGQATYNTGSAKDNVGGAATAQGVSEYSPTSTTCTAPDGSAGVQFDLVAANNVETYNAGQIFSSAEPSAANEQCVSTTTGAYGGSATYTITGGSGNFAHVSGTFTLTFTGSILAAPGSPSGANGVFGANQFTTTGSLTK
jgi:hypothetical protein